MLDGGGAALAEATGGPMIDLAHEAGEARRLLPATLAGVRGGDDSGEEAA